MKKENSINRKTILSEKSPFSYREAFNEFRTQINFVIKNSGLKKILITSSVECEGKTITAINLGISLAQSGQKILLIDADMRKASVEKYLGISIENDSGLTDYLNGKADRVCIHSNLSVDYLFAGATQDDPNNLLISSKFSKLLNELETKYDIILLDSPPVMAVSDAINISQFCDGVILVVRHNYTKKDDVKRTKQRLEQVGAHMIGTVMSQYKPRFESRQKSYYY